MTWNLEKSDGQVHCSVKNAAVFCVKTIVKESRKFELAHLKKKKEKKKKKKKKKKEEEEEEEEERKKNILAIWWLSGSVLSWCVLVHKGNAVTDKVGYRNYHRVSRLYM